jgi:diguanylate cyclase (GGDEF)-like protein/PAS domain S-box-containing protein
MPVKPKSAVKSKSASKTKPAVKKKSAVKPNKKLNSKQNDFANITEEIISNVCVGIYIVQNGKFAYVSPLFQRLSGYSHSDLLSTNPLDFVHPEDRETVRQKAINCLTEKCGSYEYRFVTKKGEIIWVMEMITSITYKGKRAALGSFIDITEHKHIEDKLRRSEGKYRTILEDMEEGYFEISLEGNFTFVNDAECKNLGYSREELIGMNNRQYTDEENAKKAFQAFSNLYKTGESCKIFDYEVTRKDGTKAIAELLVSLVKDSKGKPIGFRGLSRQITERKRMEDELRRSEEKYRTILENIEDGYTELDLHGNFIFFNEALCKIQGYPREELIKKNYRDLMDEENAKKIFARYNKVYTTDESEKEVQYEIITKSGLRKHLETSITPMKDASGRIFAFRGIVRDRTESRQAEEVLRQSEEKYRTIIETIQDGYFETDLTGKFTFINDAECNNLGYTREELIAMERAQYAGEKNRKLLINLFIEIYKTGIPVKAYALELTKKDGTQAYNEISVSLIRNSQGEPIGFRGIARDVTERKQAEEVLRQSEEKYRNIIETITEGYFELDIAGKYVFINDVICQHLKYSQEELIGIDNRSFQTPENAQKTFHAFKKVYDTGIPINALELEITRKDGTIGFFEVSISLLKDRHGAPVGFRGISRDITERKQSEEELALLRSAMDVSHDMIFLVDRTTMRFLYANDTALRLTGYTREECMKMSPQDLLLVDRKTLEHAYDEAIAAAPAGITIEMRGRIKDGTRTIAELHRRALNIGNRWIIVTITHDISQRWLAEQSVLLLGRMFAALSATNETILHAKSPEEMYQRVCDAAVDGGKFITTGILLFDPGTTWVRVASASGAGMDSLRKARISLDETIPEGKGFVGTAFRTGKPCVSNDYLKDAVSLAWRENVEKVGSAAVVPLLRNGQSIGALIFYATEKRAFDGEIVKLLEGMAENVVFALDNFERGAERKLLEETIRQSEERYRTIINEMEEWYFETDLTGNITFFNDIFANILGYSPEELTGLNFRSFIKKEDSDSVYRLFNQVYKTGKPSKNFPYEFVRTDGTVTSAEFSIFSKLDKEAKIVGFRGVGHDITERKRAEEKIQYMATHDALTGLPNRLMFSQLLNHAIQAARRYQRQFAVLFLDLDRFKTINDTMGHEAGDQLLQEIAMRLKQTLRAVDIVARLGGDEFVILIEELSDLSQIEIVAGRILSAVIKPVNLVSEECRVTASIGISVFPRDAVDEQSLMKNADLAMYLAKEEGKNNYQFYSVDIQSKSLELLSIETNLRFALERNELSLHYQAKVDFKTNAITGVEALLRWQNPYLSSVTPTQFIPVAEESGLIIPIGRWVMRTACAQNVAWQREGLPPVCMAVNLSPRQLMDEFLIEDIKKALNDSGMAPNLLELEITESMVMHNPTRMIAVLAKIKSLGVRLAIDDFGTGYSSLAQIKHFPVDTLKVDRSFVRNIPKDAEDKAITEAIIAMGKTLSLTVVAEGVETIEQMNFLKDHSCDEMQGYYFSKPIVPE